MSVAKDVELEHPALDQAPHLSALLRNSDKRARRLLVYAWSVRDHQHRFHHHPFLCVRPSETALEVRQNMRECRVVHPFSRAAETSMKSSNTATYAALGGRCQNATLAPKSLMYSGR